MRQWIQRLFLYTGYILLLFHNLESHHHDDDGHDQHCTHNLLEHIKIDHQFLMGHSTVLATPEAAGFITPQLIFLPEVSCIELPEALYLLPEEPYPPAKIPLQTILRGPPFNC